MIRNIFFRVKVLDAIKSNSVVYYDYAIKETERPEEIAFKYYKDIDLFWLVLLPNQIVDPLYDWPLPYQSFVNYMNKKYAYLGEGNGIDLSKEFIHHDEIHITTTDSGTGLTTEITYQIDSNTYANTAETTTTVVNLPDGTTSTIVTTTSQVSYFDYEYNLNESKRNIKLIDKKYVDQIKQEFDNLTKA